MRSCAGRNSIRGGERELVRAVVIEIDRQVDGGRRGVIRHDGDRTILTQRNGKIALHGAADVWRPERRVKHLREVTVRRDGQKSTILKRLQSADHTAIARTASRLLLTTKTSLGAAIENLAHVGSPA